MATDTGFGVCWIYFTVNVSVFSLQSSTLPVAPEAEKLFLILMIEFACNLDPYFAPDQVCHMLDI